MFVNFPYPQKIYQCQQATAGGHWDHRLPGGQHHRGHWGWCWQPLPCQGAVQRSLICLRRQGEKNWILDLYIICWKVSLNKFNMNVFSGKLENNNNPTKYFENLQSNSCWRVNNKDRDKHHKRKQSEFGMVRNLFLRNSYTLPLDINVLILILGLGQLVWIW